ncbi:MAG: hypothetical protein IKA71_00030 [Lentisphaeria bacterium]|nr:hypothetical protein [Lentisphaeria bacterium]
MIRNFTYSLREATPEFRFAELRFSIPAQEFVEFHNFGIAPAHLDGGLIFSIKCSLAECGRYILKRVCELCITVSSFLCRAVRAVGNCFSRIVRQRFEKQTTYLSCCVFRC